jgi:hypothetical protein
MDLGRLVADQVRSSPYVERSLDPGIELSEQPVRQLGDALLKRLPVDRRDLGHVGHGLVIEPPKSIGIVTLPGSAPSCVEVVTTATVTVLSRDRLY